MLHVPGCNSEACDLDQFIDVVKPILLTDWYTECHNDSQINLLIYYGNFECIKFGYFVKIFQITYQFFFFTINL